MVAAGLRITFATNTQCVVHGETISGTPKTLAGTMLPEPSITITAVTTDYGVMEVFQVTRRPSPLTVPITE